MPVDETPVEGRPEAAVLQDVVRRIREVCDPDRIILFGSAVRGGTGPESDLDILVVVSPGTHRRGTVRLIYRNMVGVARPVDVVVATTEDLERYGASPALVFQSALREGKVIYDRATSAA